MILGYITALAMSIVVLHAAFGLQAPFGNIYRLLHITTGLHIGVGNVYRCLALRKWVTPGIWQCLSLLCTRLMDCTVSLAMSIVFCTPVLGYITPLAMSIVVASREWVTQLIWQYLSFVCTTAMGYMSIMAMSSVVLHVFHGLHRQLGNVYRYAQRNWVTSLHWQCLALHSHRLSGLHH